MARLAREPGHDIPHVARNAPCGRPPTVSAEGLARLKREAEQRDIQQRSFTSNEFEDALLKVMQDEAFETTGSIVGVKLPSERTIRDIRREAAPLAVHNPSSQNDRRWLVGMDVRNELSVAAVAAVALDPSRPGAHPPSWSATPT